MLKPMKTELHFTMIKQHVADKLNSWKRQGKIFILRDMDGFINLYVERTAHKESLTPQWEEFCKNTLSLISQIESLEDLTQEEREFIEDESDPIGQNLFWVEKSPKLESWFEKNGKSELEAKYVTFYSYKGGVGRSTLAAFTALQLSQKYKVLIIDADLEAPGLIWQFYDPVHLEQNFNLKYGLVDAISSLHLASLKGQEKKLNFKSDFLFGDDIQYPNLWFLSAGRMSSESEYVQALSRIQTFSVDSLYLAELLKQMEEEIQPDIVIFDSRTGFCDMAGILIHQISDFAVFVGYPDAQTRHGLNFFSAQIRNLEIDETTHSVTRCGVAWVHSPGKMKDGMLDPEEEMLFEQMVEESLIHNKPLQSILHQISEESEKKFFVRSVLERFENVFHIPWDADVRAIVRKHLMPGLKIRSKNLDGYLSLIELIERELNSTESIGALDAITEGLNPKESFAIALKELRDSNFENFGAAENEFGTDEDFKRDYFPLDSLKQVFHPQKFLVLGPKGSGKTALEKLLRANMDRPENLMRSMTALTGSFPVVKKWMPLINESNLKKIKAHVTQLRALDSDEWVSLWYLFVIRTIEKKSQISEAAEIDQIFLDIKTLSQPELSKSFEQLNESLTEGLFLTTDKLDDIFTSEDRTTESKMISSLIVFWWDQSNVPNMRIHGKVFLRRDFFARFTHQNKGHIENSCSTDLHFSFDELMALMIKRLCSRSPALLNLIQSQTGTLIRKHDFFGLIPDSHNKEFIQRAIEVIFGKTITQSKSQKWLMRYLSDASFTNYPPRFSLYLLKKLIYKSQVGKECLFQVKKTLDEVYPEVAESYMENEFYNMYPDLKEILIEFKKNIKNGKGKRRSHFNLEDLKTVLGEVLKVKNVKSRKSLEYVISDMQLAGLIYRDDQGRGSQSEKGVYIFPEMYRVALGLSKPNSIPPAR